MKNSEQPITPIHHDGFCTSKTNIDAEKECIGLNKREYFAGLVMKSILNRPFPSFDEMDSVFVEWAAEFSVEMADALLVQLDKPKQQDKQK